MSETTESVDVLILGAGVAGLAAAQALLHDELEVLVLEARDRLGGRAHTDRSFAGFPLELGAEFVHGERAATWRLIDELGLRTVHWNKRDDSWVRLADGRRLLMAEARTLSPAFDLSRSFALPDLPPRPYESFGAYLVRAGAGAETLDYVRRAFANAAGESMRHLDATALLASMESDEDGYEDFRMVDGYGAVVEALGVGNEIRTRSQVTRVAVRGDRVVVDTADGARFDAATAIITLPLGVLQSGDIEFDPPLPAAKLEALGALGMGPVAKLIYRFAEPLTPPEIKAVYAAGNPPMWWSPSAGQDTDAAVAAAVATVWTAFVSGDGAVELLRFGHEDALERALESLRRELGRPGLRPLASLVVDWTADPYSRGGYSYVRPGGHGAREKLAAPTPPLYWAGEATQCESRAATVHGALLSGERAAREVRLALREVVRAT